MSDEQRRHELGRLRQDVLDAEDARLLRIVHFVDRLPDRGDADALLAPLRPRLEVLRPPRPLNLRRLMFLPLDPLIVAPQRWKPGALGIPRTVLPPLIAAVLKAIGPVAADVQARIDGHQMLNADVVLDAGEVLWPAAAAALAGDGLTLALPAGNSIDAADVSALLRPIGCVLAHGAAIYRSGVQPDGSADPADIELLLAAAARHSAIALEMMLAVLLAQTFDAGQHLRLAEELAARHGHPAPDRALDFVLGAYGDAGVAEDGIAAGTDAMRRAAILMDGMERRPAQRPAQSARLERLRQRLDRTCRQRFEARADRLGRAAPHRAKQIADAEVGGIEHAALELRRLEALARRVGGAGFDDTPMRRAAERLAAAAWLTPVDRLRLAEILLGPDAALALADLADLGADPGGNT